MTAQPHDDIDNDSDELDPNIERELVRRLGEADAAHRSAQVTLAGRRYHLVPVEDVRTPARDRVAEAPAMPEAASLVASGEDPFRNYDPERARAAVAAAAGALKGLDVEAFMEEIMKMRA